MIHWRNEGQHFRIGLNFMLARGHFSVCWVSYDFARQKGSFSGFDLSRRGLKRRSARWNVIDNFLRMHNMALVHAETLEDLVAAEQASMRRNEPFAYLKPQAFH